MTEAIEPMIETATQSLMLRLVGAGVFLSDPASELIENVRPQGRLVDEGIGPYEFWGAPGHDRRIVFECEDAGCETVRWCQEEPPFVGEFVTLLVEILADAGPEEALEPVQVMAVLDSFSTRVESIGEGSDLLQYWRCEATYSWKVKPC